MEKVFTIVDAEDRVYLDSLELQDVYVSEETSRRRAGRRRYCGD